MALVFVVAQDWNMRTAVRAELREKGVVALGMDSAEDVAGALVLGKIPDVVVLEAAAEFFADPTIQNLLQRVPFVLIASRTVAVPLPRTHTIFYRPVRIAEIVDCVRELLARHPAS
jgi:hypothetical protein